jgi:hypothetical protein
MAADEFHCPGIAHLTVKHELIMVYTDYISDHLWKANVN